MKYFTIAIWVFFFAALPARANTDAYAHCGTYDSYILLYKSTQKFEELGKLRCGEKIEVVASNDDYTKVQTADGRTGWVINSDLSASAPPPQEVYTFGLTAPRRAEEAQPVEIPREQLVAARAAGSASTGSGACCGGTGFADYERQCDENAGRSCSA